MTCPHAIDVNIQGTVQCRLGLFGGFPHRGVCQGCDAPKIKDRKAIAAELARIQEEEQVRSACKDHSFIRRAVNNLKNELN